MAYQMTKILVPAGNVTTFQQANQLPNHNTDATYLLKPFKILSKA
jgi:hypothetical protein